MSRRRSRNGARRSADSNIEEMEELWQEAKRDGMIESQAADPTHAELDGSASGFRRKSGDSHDIELLPVRLFVVATKVGGQVFGAFDGDRMIGFLLAIPGIKPGGGVVPAQPHDGRAAGVSQPGRRPHAEAAAARGSARSAAIDLVEWTFDPLELKNAFFNIERLGAIVRRYVLNQYGTTTQPSARRPAHRPLRGRMARSPARAYDAILAGQPPHADDRRRASQCPLDIADLRMSDPRSAREIQQRVSEQFLEELRPRPAPSSASSGATKPASTY